MDQAWLWIGFNVFVLVMLAIDLGIFHKEAHEVKFKEAITWTLVWISLALIFNIGIYLYRGEQAAVEFFVGYLIEKSLSVDNIFVFLLIFNFFKVPGRYQHKVLFWGILGALIMRAIFIFAGITLIEKFHWMIYVFGGFLILTGIKMALPKKDEIDLEKTLIIRVLKRVLPITPHYHGDKFFIQDKARWVATPLFVTLVFVEITDVIFAVDSIPAILAITRDSFIVYTSNVFAILGLRSLYFALAGFANMFHYLQYGLAAILSFVGIKMLISDHYKLHPIVSLLVIFIFLSLSVLASIHRTKRLKRAELP